MSFTHEMERHKKIVEKAFLAIDSLSPETRALVYEHGCPTIEHLVVIGYSTSSIIQHIEEWAKTMPVTSQPQLAA